MTVEPPEKSKPGNTEIVVGSFWAEVVASPGLDKDTAVYSVRPHSAKKEDPPLEIQRQYLRHRKLHTKAYFGVTDDKKHDSFAAQYFILATLRHLFDTYVQTGVEHISSLLMHSDNAASHFKSSKTMYFLTTIAPTWLLWCNAALDPASATYLAVRNLHCFWEFGCPGHGKGVWDGLGALIKRTVRQDIIDDRPRNKTVLTESGCIRNAEEVAEHVKARFCNQEWVDQHLHKTVNEIVVHYVPANELHATRPNPDHECASLEGVRKAFSFFALAAGVVAKRAFGCWCPACLQICGRGEGTMGADLKVAGCPSAELAWAECSVERSDAAGVANARTRTRAIARGLAKRLREQLESGQVICFA